MTPNRKKRPELERSEPIRNWSGMFGARGRSVPPHGVPASERPAPSDPIARGVDLGYRVIDQYLQQGQAFARSVAPGSRAGTGFGAADPQRFTEQLARSTFDFAASFLDLLSASGAGGTPAPGRVGAAPPSPAEVSRVGAFEIESAVPRQPSAAEVAPRQPSQGESTRQAPPPPSAAAGPDPAPELGIPLTSIDVRSATRTEVTLELKPGSAALQLFAHDLRAVDPALPRIGGVLLESFAADNRVAVRVRVPDAQPAATYTGLILDEATHLPRGSLTVRTFDERS